MSAGLLAACGLLLLGAVLMTRVLELRRWAANLRAFKLQLPANLTAGDVSRWLSTVAAATRQPRGALLPAAPVVLELVADSRGVRFFLLAAEGQQSTLLASLRAALPGARVSEAPDYVTQRPKFRAAAEAALTNPHRPLATDRAEAASAALLAALQPLPPGYAVRLSWLLAGAGTPPPAVAANRKGGSPWWLEAAAPQSADDAQARRAKQRDVLLRAVLRLGVAAPTTGQAHGLLARVWPMFSSLNAPGARLVRRSLPSSVVAKRLAARRLPVGRWPLLLGSRELCGLLGLPIGGVYLPGLQLGAARQLPPTPDMPSCGAVIGVSNYPGMDGRAVALKPADRLMHQYIVGPTGSGKSVLITNMVVQDFANGHGGAVFDPKGDLIEDILARLSSEDLERIVVLDANDRQWPIGFNILGHTRDEAERELAVDNVLHIFHELWADFWGPRTDNILRAALSTLTAARAADGSAFTACELPALLTSATFRSFVTCRANLPDALRDFWLRFESQSENERTQAIAPVLNKIDAFVQRTSIRLMLGQGGGFDMRSIFRERKLLLVNLAKGAIGSETAGLLGALLVSSLWQATLSRVHTPPERRRPVFAYIDEAQDIMKLPIPLPDVLSQARGLGLGLIMANQYFAQLPSVMQAAVLGTVRTTVAFAVDYDDARLLERRYAPLTSDDLRNLARFEVAARCCADGQTRAPVTLATLPPAPVQRAGGELAGLVRERHGVPRTEVEEAMRRRLETGNRSGQGFGRIRQAGGRS